MDFTRKKLIRYCEDHSTPPSAVLQELERETNLKTLAPQMLSGHIQGQLFRLISLLKRPKYILEVGTFTAYAAICLAEGLPEDGEIHSIEANEELAYIIEKYIQKAGLENKFHLHIGDAKALLPTFQQSFDMVFIDAAKNDYALYYDLIIDKVSPGGLILSDNVLWDSKVVKKGKERDSGANVLDAFNKKIHSDPRVENLILPIRDGIMIARKI